MKVYNHPIRTILLIDDDKDDCALFKEALHEVDPQVTLVCQNTTDAIPLTILDVNPDIIFLDINMPRVNGFDCLKMLYESVTKFRMPIVMYSNTVNHREINIAYALGASLFLQKPSGYIKLLESIRGLLSMPWNSPAEIKLQYFQKGQYLPYEVF